MKIPLVVLCAMLGALNLSAEKTEAIMARMDEAALTFKGVSADVKMTVYTKVIDDKDIESGRLVMQRPPGKATRALLEISGQTDAHTVFLHDDIVRIYTPKLKMIQDYNVGKSSDVLSQFLLLGFGSSGKELLESYDVNNAGTEIIDGRETTRLVLLPKSSKVKKKLSKVEVWIPVGEASPTQQQFVEPNGNYRIMRYTKIQLNPQIKGGGMLEYKPPPGTKKQ